MQAILFLMTGLPGLLIVLGTCSEAPGEALTLGTIRAALAYYAIAILLMLTGRSRRLALWTWTWSCAIYVVHVLLAFHFYHHWSHETAMAHVESESGIGEGIFVSYFFTLTWLLDAAWWQLWPRSHSRRPRALTIGLHAFMLFIVFNGTVVYETGWIRWCGVAFFIVLGAAVAAKNAKRN